MRGTDALFWATIIVVMAVLLGRRWGKHSAQLEIKDLRTKLGSARNRIKFLESQANLYEWRNKN